MAKQKKKTKTFVFRFRGSKIRVEIEQAVLDEWSKRLKIKDETKIVQILLAITKRPKKQI